MNDFDALLSQASACEDPRRRARMYEQLAKQGCTEAQYRLAVCYYEGDGVEESVEMAIGWLRKAAELGDEDAVSYLGALLLESEEAAESAEGERLCRERSQAGDALAALNLGNFLYRRGRYAEALPLLLHASREGLAAATYRLGYCYLYGMGVEKDYPTAFRLLLEAAEQGDIRAAYYTAVCYLSGSGIGQDEEAARRWFSQSAEAAYPPAMRMLGGMLQEHAETRDQGTELLKRAADAGMEEAMFDLSLFYGREQQPEESEHWLRQAAEAGSTEAQCNLGVDLMELDRSAEEQEEALHWLLKAAEAQDRLAWYNLGLYYEARPHLPQAGKMAVAWLKRAADTEYLPALYRLSEHYATGDGVRRNMSTALRMLRYAADGGHVSAAYTYGRMLRYGSSRNREESSEILAVTYLRRAMKAGMPDAACELGLCYAEGSGVPQDRAACLRCMRKALARDREGTIPGEVLRIASAREAAGDTETAMALFRLLSAHGFAPALYALGFCLYRGTPGSPADAVAAYRCWARGAKLGHLHCILEYADCLRRGDGCPARPRKALPWWRKAAEAGSAEGWFQLGYAYDVGKGAPKDQAKANEMYRRTLEIQEHAQAAYNLGINSLYGYGMEEDEPLAFSCLCKAYELGMKRARMEIAQCHLHGWGTEKNVPEAVRLYTDCAKEGNVQAMVKLWHLYRNGAGELQADMSMAAHWMHRAAERGDADSMEQYGIYFDSWVKGEYGARKAFYWWSRGAELSHQGCLYNLGYCYYHGRGVPRDYAKAVEYFRRCLELGRDAVAELNLGLRYFYGEGVEQNDAEALRYLSMAREDGDTEAAAYIGCLYYLGRGVRRNRRRAEALFEEACRNDADGTNRYWIAKGLQLQSHPKAARTMLAFRYMRESAELGHASACCDLGHCYYWGLGTEKNYADAVVWFRRCLELDAEDEVAAFNLGLRYYYGEGVEQDDAEAWRYLSQSAELGYGSASRQLGMMCEKGRGTEKDPRRALRYYRRAAAQGSTTAIFRMGRCFELGIGVAKPRLSRAVSLYRQAAERGSADARKALKRLGQ